MGIKPNLFTNEHFCPNPFWAGGLQPSFIVIGFEGWAKGPDYPSYPIAPPEGFYYLDWQRCGQWHFRGTWIEITAYIDGGDFVVDLYMIYVTVFLRSRRPMSDPHDLGFVYLSSIEPWTIGAAKMLTFSSGKHPHPSWIPADLFGVPETEGYFAEDLPPTQYRRFVRYASHLDGTNIKIIGDI